MPKAELYQKIYTTTDYGKATKGKCQGVKSFDFYRNYLNGKIIDLGCGSGDTVKLLRANGYEADGIDQIDLDNGMMVGDASQFDCSGYDTAVTFDVIEHLTLEELDSLFKNMKKCDRQIIQVFCGEDSGRYADEPLHLIVENISWWRDKIHEHFKIQFMQQLNGRQYIFFCGNVPVEREAFTLPPKYKMRLIWNEDGSFFIPRNNRELENYLDRYCIKVENRKYFPPIMEGYSIERLKDKYKDQVAYVVGKGPSLDKLTPEYFKEPGPVICVNDSINLIPKLDHPIFVTQSDLNLKEDCLPKDENVAMLLHIRLQKFYRNFHNKYFFHGSQLDPNLAGPGGAVGSCFGKYMGCKKIVLLCFDACVNKNTAYAKCVGYESNRWGMSPNRFLQHRQKIDKFLTDIDNEWIIPGDQNSHESTSSDTPQQLSDNLALHHGHDHTGQIISLPTKIETPLKRGRIHQKTIVDHLKMQQQS